MKLFILYFIFFWLWDIWKIFHLFFSSRVGEDQFIILFSLFLISRFHFSSFFYCFYRKSNVYNIIFVLTSLEFLYIPIYKYTYRKHVWTHLNKFVRVIENIIHYLFENLAGNTYIKNCWTFVQYSFHNEFLALMFPSFSEFYLTIQKLWIMQLTKKMKRSCINRREYWETSWKVHSEKYCWMARDAHKSFFQDAFLSIPNKRHQSVMTGHSPREQKTHSPWPVRSKLLCSIWLF